MTGAADQRRGFPGRAALPPVSSLPKDREFSRTRLPIGREPSHRGKGVAEYPRYTVSTAIHAANYPWVLLNPRYLEKAMQDHQALKTIRFEIKSIKDRIIVRTKIQLPESLEATRRSSFKVNGILWMQGAEAQTDRCS